MIYTRRTHGLHILTQHIQHARANVYTAHVDYQLPTAILYYTQVRTNLGNISSPTHFQSATHLPSTIQFRIKRRQNLASRRLGKGLTKGKGATRKKPMLIALHAFLTARLPLPPTQIIQKDIKEKKHHTHIPARSIQLPSPSSGPSNPDYPKPLHKAPGSSLDSKTYDRTPVHPALNLTFDQEGKKPNGFQLPVWTCLSEHEPASLHGR